MLERKIGGKKQDRLVPRDGKEQKLFIARMEANQAIYFCTTRTTFPLAAWQEWQLETCLLMVLRWLYSLSRLMVLLLLYIIQVLLVIVILFFVAALVIRNVGALIVLLLPMLDMHNIVLLICLHGETSSN